MGFIIDNLGTVFVLLIVLSVVGLLIYSLIRNKKEGKSSCGCGCSDCPMKSQCQGGEKKG